MSDCLIVGGGAVGLSLAYELAQHGQRVRVIDRSEPGRESSWAGAGILPPAVDHPRADSYERLQALSHRLHTEWAERFRREVEIDNGFRRCGAWYLGVGHNGRDALATEAADLSRRRVRFDDVEPATIADREPALAAACRAGRVTRGLFLPDEYQVRNPRHVRALLEACRRRGVEVTSGDEAIDFEIRGGRVVSVRTSRGETLAAEAVCIASGAWSRGVLEPLGWAPAIKPIRGQIALVAASRLLFSSIIYASPRYLVPRDDGRILIGSTVEDVGFDKRTRSESIAELLVFAHGLVPELCDAAFESSWAGLRPGSADGLPYLGRVPGLDNAFVAAGHFRWGLLLSPGTAVVMSQLIRGESPQVDLAPFRLDR